MESGVETAGGRVAQALSACFAERAAAETVVRLTIGLGYTAVTLAGGDVGLSYSMPPRSTSCTRVRTYRDYEGGPASDLLGLLCSDDSLERSMGMATLNALNRQAALDLPVDGEEDGALARVLPQCQGAHVAMVGFFGPVVKRLEAEGAEVRILDSGRGIGDEQSFLDSLAAWPDLLILTATSLLNGSLERVVGHVGEAVKVIVLGPSTPLVPAAFEGLRVDVLAGMVTVRTEGVLAAVRQGGGTPQLMPFCRKVYCMV